MTAFQRETARRAALAISAHLDSLRAPMRDAARLRLDLLDEMRDERQELFSALLAQAAPSYPRVDSPNS
jgi:hypothetical protein